MLGNCAGTLYRECGEILGEIPEPMCAQRGTQRSNTAVRGSTILLLKSISTNASTILGFAADDPIRDDFPEEI